MGKEKSYKPRKTPSQKRALDTVEAIYEAAAQVFSHRGYAKATTDKIAERAGVSIGSLYQYFPNKEAIAVELMKRHVNDSLPRLEAILAQGFESQLSIGGLLGSLIEATVVSHEKDPNLYRVLMDEVPYSVEMENDMRQRLEYFTGVAESLIRQHPSTRIKNPKVAAHLLTMGIQSMVHWYICYHYEELDREAFIEEITLMFQRYLSPVEP